MTENKEKNVNNFLNIRVVLDRSGSMSNCVDQTIDALNGYLIGMQKENTEGVVTISLFDSQSITIGIDKVQIKDLSPLDYSFLDPRASTPLYDAIGAAIYEHSNYEVTKEDKKVLVIVTDGLENASREYSGEAIKKLVEEKEEAGWLIVYLGSDHDIYKQTRMIGIDSKRSIRYSKGKSDSAFKSVLRTSGDYYKGTKAIDIEFTEEERRDAEEDK
tara:strand:+ start:289 stop:936 length:648 start_codon:yes stop_codon:yes gene_type:complete